MKTLIIAEKPDQIDGFAKALGFRKNGDLYEKENFLMIAAWGHLIELAQDTTYRPDGKWDKAYLPILPAFNQYVYEPKRGDKGRKIQLDKIGRVLNRGDINMLYVATDPDREGELIFRYIYNYFNCKIPFSFESLILRIWLQ